MNNDSKKRKCIIVSICLVIVLAIISCVFIKKNISNDNNYKTTEKNKDTATKTEVVDKTTEVVTTEKSKSNNKKGGSISSGVKVKKDHNTKESTSEEKSTDNNTKTPGTTEYTGNTEEPTTQRQADNDGVSTRKPPKKDDSEKNSGGEKEPETTQTPVTPEKPDNTDDKPAQHVHTWKEYTKEHPAVTHKVTKHVKIKDAWDEEVTTTVQHIFCGGCDMDLTAAGYCPSDDDFIIHIDSCQGGSSYYTYPVSITTKEHHDPVYEDQTVTVTVTDKEAWTEHWKECTTCGAIEK
ncbi:MAG: hypothetical protein ACLRMT_08545 [Coprococcus sp.]